MTHEWRNAGIGIAVLILIAGAFGIHYWYTNVRTAAAPEPRGQVAGETDDGASIPDGVPTAQTVKMGETVRIAGASIRPTEIAEDNRCPKDAQCIQAGTVRVGAVVIPRGGVEADAQPVMFQLGVPMTVGLDQIMLIDVTPAPSAGKTIAPTEYVFTFSVTKGAGTEYFKG